MIEIYGKSTSINVRKILWACHELQKEFNLDEDILNAKQSPSSLVHFHPNGLMPVIRDGGFVLWESNAILRYLAECYSPNPLWSEDPKRRAQVSQWLDWQAIELNAAWSYAFQHIVRKNTQFNDARQLDISLNSWEAHIQVLESVLGKSGKFLIDDTFSLADIPIALSLNRRFCTFNDSTRFPAAKAYFERLADREGFCLYCDNGIH